MPEVETVRRELASWLGGRRILAARLEDAVPGPKYLGLERVKGQTVLGVGRRGKFLILPLDGGDELIVHLGMTGRLTPKRPEKHLRVTVALDGSPNPALYFQDARRFGRFLAVPAGDYRCLPTLAAMGPEPLSKAFTERSFYAALQASSVAVKSYLLSQRPVSGVGNIYADEALWRSGIHPLTPARRVPRRKVPMLMRAIREVLEASIVAQGTTLNDYRTVGGEAGAYSSELKAYGQAGKPCTRCGVPIERMVLAGRGTHYCPSCQRPSRQRVSRR